MIRKMAALFCAIFLSLSLRYVYVFHYAGFSHVAEGIGGDAQDYLEIAYSLSKTGVFGYLDNVDPKEDLLLNRGSMRVATSAHPGGVRPPLWPVALSLMMRLAAYNLRTMMWLRFLLDSVTLILFYRLLSYTQFSGLGRLIAVSLFALHPAWLIYSVTWLSEPFTMLIHIALALSLLHLVRSPSNVWRLLLAGLMGGLTVLVHPYYVALPVTLTVILAATGNINKRQAGIVLLLVGVVAAPWVLRNMVVFHVPSLTTFPGKIFARGWNSDFLGAYRNTTGDLAVVEVPEDMTGFNEAQRSKSYVRSALKFARTNWRLVPAIIARKVVGAIIPFPESPRAGLLESGRTIFQVLSFCSLLVLLKSRKGGWLGWLVGGEYVAYLAMSVVFLPTIRYRFPLIWVELICIVAASEFCLKAIKERRALRRTSVCISAS